MIRICSVDQLLFYWYFVVFLGFICCQNSVIILIAILYNTFKPFLVAFSHFQSNYFVFLTLIVYRRAYFFVNGRASASRMSRRRSTDRWVCRRCQPCIESKVFIHGNPGPFQASAYLAHPFVVSCAPYFNHFSHISCILGLFYALIASLVISKSKFSSRDVITAVSVLFCCIPDR